jgi:digeranylgeranylglycerophospholipid reductase
MIKKEYDVVVVGCGPAGSNTAKELAEKGFNVVIFDRNFEIGCPKRCGEGISANSVKQLKLKIPSYCIAQKINGAYVYAPNGREVKIKFKGTEGYILERKVFDKWLAKQAVAAGAEIFSRATVTDVLWNGNFVNGVKVETIDGLLEVRSKIVVAADGVESLVMRKAGIRTNKNPQLVDSGFQYEMAGIKLRDPHMIELFFGNEIAKRGYVWIFPKGKDCANVGVGISGAVGDVKRAKAYLDDFISRRRELSEGSIIEVNGGCIPVGGLMKNMVGNGILGVGDAVNQVNPIHGGGIAESIKAAKIAAEVIVGAFKKKDFSEKMLSQYNKKWWEERGKHLQKVERLREMVEKMTDQQLNDLAEILNGEDLSEFAHGRRLPKLIKIAAKMKMREIARKIGF